MRTLKHHFCRVLVLAATLGAMCGASLVEAWNSAGHMVVGAIAHCDLAARDPKAVEEILRLMKSHPHCEIFELNMLNAATSESAQREILFMEMDRWPDD